MRFLQEVISIMQVYREKQVTETSFSQQDSKYEQLFDAIKSEEVKTDEDAIRYLYPKSLSRPTYLRLKSRFRQKLIDRLFLIDYPYANYSDIQRAFFITHKNWAATRMLFGRGLKEAGAYLAKKTIKNALRYEFTNLVIDLSRLLLIYSSAVAGNRKDFKKYSDILDTHLIIQQAEVTAEKYSSDIYFHFALSKSGKKDLLPILSKYSEALMKYPAYCETYNFLTFAYGVHSVKCEIANNHQELIEVCNTAIAKMEAKNYELRNLIAGLYLRKVSAQLKLGLYDDVEETSQFCFEKTTPNTVNWFKFYQSYFSYLAYTKRYQDIPKYMYPILHSKRLKFQSRNIQETWLLIRAYIQLFIELEVITEDPEYSLPRFRVGKFMNEIPDFSKDKRGYNIDVLIVQIMIAFAKDNINFVVNRMDALKVYSSRYLKKDGTFRSNCFIQILRQLPKSGFYRERFLLNTKKYRKKLKEVSLSEANQLTEFELIPYEHLLEWVVRLCK